MINSHILQKNFGGVYPRYCKLLVNINLLTTNHSRILNDKYTAKVTISFLLCTIDLGPLAVSPAQPLQLKKYPGSYYKYFVVQKVQEKD